MDFRGIVTMHIVTEIYKKNRNVFVVDPFHAFYLLYEVNNSYVLCSAMKTFCTGAP